MRVYDEATLAELAPHPAQTANKYSRGRLVLVVGSAMYPGAAALASLAGQRAGAGYTEAYVEDSIQALVQGFSASLVVRRWSEWAPDCETRMQGHPHAYVVGCGFDAQDPYVAGITRQLLKTVAAPVLVDGGALHMLSARKIADLCRKRSEAGYATVLTPHGGEARVLARAQGIDASAGGELSQRIAQAYNAVCVLKGPDTFISDGQDVYCMGEGTAALAKAGTGDVLAGAIGALLAQGLDALDAAMLGATLHARAGCLAAARISDVSVTAEDVIDHIGEAILRLSAG